MDKHDRILAECERRGLTVARVGKVWHIIGRGVDIRVLQLDSVDVQDLIPHQAGRSSARHHVASYTR